MKALLYITDFIVPTIILLIVAYGVMEKVKVYDEFIRGAKKGFYTVIRILPTLVGLMVAVGILRASGFLEFLSGILGKVTDCENVFVVGFHGTFVGFVQGIWNGFTVGAYCIDYDELHRNHILYNERVFYGGESQKDKIYLDRGVACNLGRHDSKCVAGGVCVVLGVEVIYAQLIYNKYFSITSNGAGPISRRRV